MRGDVLASFSFRKTDAPASFSTHRRCRRGGQRVNIACNAVVQELEPRVLLAATPINSFIPGQSVHGGVTIGGVSYYDAYQGPHSSIYQLMRTDGTPGGTYTLTEYEDGVAGWDPADFYNFNGMLYYEAQGGLYRSDGTIAGTFAVSTSTDADPSFTQVGSELYFFGTDSSGNENLYKTDGTSAGPKLVQTLESGVRRTPQLIQPSMANLNGTLYFTTPDLWKLDAGGQPELVKSFGDQNSAGGELIAVNNTLYFKAQDPSNPYQLDLWESDGTAAGTKVLWTDGISNLPDSGDSFAFDNDLYFVSDSLSTGYQLHRTDGSIAGTTLLTSPGFTFDAQVGFAVANSRLFFAAANGPSTGATIWTSDGTAAGTMPVGDPSIGVTSMKAGDGVLYFIAGNGDLYDTDGLSSALADPSETSNGWTANRLLGQATGGFMFGATDSSGNETTWVLPAPASLPAPVPPPVAVPPPFTPSNTTISFGSPVLLQAVSDNPSPAQTSFGSSISIGGIVYYTADDVVHGWQVWKTDGTAAGTSMVSDFNAPDGFYPANLTDFNGTLYFMIAVTTGTGLVTQDLYKSDGTPGGTTLVAADLWNNPPLQLGNELYFIADDSSTGTIELYKTDGTTAGTMVVPGVLGFSGQNTPSVINMVVMGGNLYVEGGADILQLTPAGQTQVVATPGYPDPREPEFSTLYATDNAIYFTVGYPISIYVNDGTPGSTSLVFSNGKSYDVLYSAYAAGNDLFFQVGETLYRTDGTAAGTSAVPNRNGNYNPNDPQPAPQLWATDGTGAGTGLVAGSVGTSGNTLVANNSLYFVGSNGGFYQTDGTFTAWINPLASPGPAETGSLMGLSANGLIFSSGTELWALSTQAAPPPGTTTPMLPPAPQPQSALVPKLGRVSLESQALAGSKVHATVPIIVTNTGTTSRGTVTIELFADNGMGLDGNQVLLSTKTLRGVLKANQNAAFEFNIKSLPASLQEGAYHLIADVIDPSGDTNSVATAQTVQVQTGFVQPSAAVVSVTPATIAPGRFGSIVVTVSNKGTADATGGRMTLSLLAGPFNPSSGVTLKTVRAGLAVPAGKTRQFRIRFRVPADTKPGNYFLYAPVSLNGSAQTALGSAAVLIG